MRLSTSSNLSQSGQIASPAWMPYPLYGNSHRPTAICGNCSSNSWRTHWKTLAPGLGWKMKRYRNTFWLTCYSSLESVTENSTKRTTSMTGNNGPRSVVTTHISMIQISAAKCPTKCLAEILRLRRNCYWPIADHVRCSAG